MLEFVFIFLSLLVASVVGAATPGLCETWQTGYTGKDATGPQVIGYWKFDSEAPTRDASGKGHELTFSGAQAVAEGKHGGALESFTNELGVDRRHAATTPNKPELSPRSAFTVELWIKPKPELATAQQVVLIDKKYASQNDYQLRLLGPDKSGNRHLQVQLGFGDTSEFLSSESFQPGTEWQHLAFTYDGAGEVRFFRNGAPLGLARKPGRGSVAPGKQPLSIGDRGGSTYAGFPGFIDEVRICDGVLEFRPVAVEFLTDRRVWRRMEKNPSIGVRVWNLGKVVATNLKVHLSLSGMAEQVVEVPTLGSGQNQELAFPFNTALRPDRYRLKVHAETAGPMPFSTDEETELTLVGRPMPRMPVVMWGFAGGPEVRREIPRLKDIGFTHCLGMREDSAAIWKAGKPVPPGTDEAIREEKTTLDFALAHDFGIALNAEPGLWLKKLPELARLDRSGKPYARTDVNAALPGLAEFCYNSGASLAQTYGAFPAWEAALINSEVRDDSQLSFSDFDRAAYRKFSGTDIPAEAMQKSGVDWSKIKGFPADRVIPDDDPLLKYYRWFWTTGDGWPALNTAVHKGLKSTGRKDVWTWFDPTIRAPSMGGSGGALDVLSQWTYTYPDPLRIGFYTDELFAMAANSPQHPHVMKMTQLIMYRSQTAPKRTGPGHIGSPFDDHDPEAAYITTAPMHVREAFWTKLARPLSGIMYHGWQSLVPTDSLGGYRYTNPDTEDVLRRLLRDVVQPLGPTLLQIDDRRSDVAYLDSSTSQMFARRGSYGYSGDEAYLTLLYAQLQPEVIYEDASLEHFKVLVLADCDVLPAGLAKRIHEFQQRGGLIIGDDNLAPAIQPDIRIPKMVRTKKGDVDKATLLASAAKLRSALDAKYTRHADSSNPEVVVRCRHADESDYVFVVNDHREFGTYIGQHGLVMENGVPSEAEIFLQVPEAHVYDLRARREIKAIHEGGRLHWPVELGPCEGGIFLVSPNEIELLEFLLPDIIKRGDHFTLSVDVSDRGGHSVPAVIPVQLQITDPSGRPAEFSGYYGAKNGHLEIPVDIATNDAPGVWQVRVRELASGLERSAYFRVVP